MSDVAQLDCFLNRAFKELRHEQPVVDFDKGGLHSTEDDDCDSETRVQLKLIGGVMYAICRSKDLGDEDSGSGDSTADGRSANGAELGSPRHITTTVTPSPASSAAVFGSFFSQADASPTLAAAVGAAASPSSAAWGGLSGETMTTTMPMMITPTTATTADGLPSVGSEGHAAGTCRPCAFARSSAGCKLGAACRFCHAPDGHAEVVRVRPCKGKRERFRRQMASIEQAVANDPDVLARGDLSLPALADRSGMSRSRIMARLTEIAADAYRERLGPDGMTF